MPSPASASHTRRLHRLLPIAWLVGLGLVGAACDDSLPTGETVRDLVVLSGDVGSTRLTIMGGDPAREIAVPDPATAWASGAARGGLVATLADGRLAVLEDATAPDGEWRVVDPSNDGEPVGSQLFAVASPDGSRVASLALGAAGQFGVALTDHATGQSVTFPIDAEPVLTSPAWLDGERVAVVVVDADTGGALSIVDAASGEQTGGPGNVRALAVSADGAVVAWTSTVDGRLYGSNARSWLAGEEVAALPIEAPDGARPGSFALDRNGSRIAIVWEDDAGEVVEIGIRARTADGWSGAERISAPGDDPRAVVTWLR
jgi:hypothetical protein